MPTPEQLADATLLQKGARLPHCIQAARLDVIYDIPLEHRLRLAKSGTAGILEGCLEEGWTWQQVIAELHALFDFIVNWLADPRAKDSMHLAMEYHAWLGEEQRRLMP